MKACTVDRFSESDFPVLGEVGILRKLFCLSIFCFLAIFLETAAVQANGIQVQIMDRSANSAETVSPAYLSRLQIGRPLKSRFSRDLFDLVQLAREISGRMDMTSVQTSIHALSETRDQDNSQDNVRIVDNSFVSPGQNTRHVVSPYEAGSQPQHDPALTCNKRIAKESPTSIALSFTREYLQTKK